MSGWDDPRLPTLCGLRRRGYTPEAILQFWEDVGVAKRENNIDIAKLESCLRNHLNKVAPRVTSEHRPPFSRSLPRLRHPELAVS